jgi:predicted dithiol-disulfide oxidoreductase (DUF899 family)
MRACARGRLAAKRRGLPRLKIEQSYTFETEQGRKTLADLFNGRGQLVAHHLMHGPEWNAACRGCSFQAEHIDGPTQPRQHHNVTIVVVFRAPPARNSPEDDCNDATVMTEMVLVVILSTPVIVVALLIPPRTIGVEQ